jgi:capsular exopolysaccharide synthesis family protein
LRISTPRPRYQDDDFDDFYSAQPQGAPNGPDRGLGQMLSLIWHRKFRVLAAMIGCSLIAYTISYMMTPRYYSEGILAVETRPIYLPQLGMAAPPQSLDITVPRSEAQILKSRSLIDAVSHELKLDDDPDLNPYLSDAPFLARIMSGARRQFVHVLRAVGIIPSAGNGSDDDAATWAAVDDNVTKRLDVRTDGKSYVMYVGFDGADPQVSSSVVNTVMKRFLTNQIESYNKSFIDANAWVKERSEELRHEVEDADKKVQAYLTAHSLVATQTGGTVSGQQLADLNTQLSLARADRAQAEARYGQAQTESKLASDAGAASSAEVLNSPLIQKLRQQEAEAMQKRAEMATRLGPTHPQIQAIKNEINNVHGQIQLETRKVLTSLQNQVVITRTREQTLEKQLSGLQDKATEVADSQVGLNQLQKEADTKRNVYQTFLATAQQTADPSRINQANARVVSSAIPPVDPTSPNKKLFAIAGLFIGFLASGATILFVSELDHGFETAADIESMLGLPVLGTLPMIRRRSPRRHGLGQELIEGPHSPVSETLRGIRVALKSLAADPDVTQVVLVTSAEPSEGKTSFASAMAAIAARDGQRVLVVDSDLRRPRFHRMFRSEPGPALQDVLRGGKGWTDAIRTDPESGAHCLTAHERTDSPVSLLSSGHWDIFLNEARKVYDLIILDSPPVIQVADALTLADYADTTIFIVAHRSTPRHMIEEALRRFGTVRKPIAGVVLSKAPGTMIMGRSYYSGYYPA